MKWQSLFMGLVFLTAVTSYGAAQGTTVVPQDSRYRTGRLDNGIMYYIQENNLPGGQMHFALVQKPVRTPFLKRCFRRPTRQMWKRELPEWSERSKNCLSRLPAGTGRT